MASQTQICNLALANLGINTLISDINGPSQEARACKVYYDISLESALESHPWNFAIATTYPPVLTTEEDSQFSYVYQLPNDVLKMWSIYPKDSNISYEERSGKVYTNQSDIEVIYTQRITDPNKFSAAFIVAFSYKLAMDIAPALSKNSRIVERMNTAWQLASLNAKALSSSSRQATQVIKHKDARG